MDRIANKIQMFNIQLKFASMVEKWYYSEMGSRDKKTGKLKYYKVSRTSNDDFGCECPAAMYRRFQECKHVKRLKEKLCI